MRFSILSSSEGNILENAEAIDAEEFEKISDEIKKKQLIAAETEKKLTLSEMDMCLWRRGARCCTFAYQIWHHLNLRINARLNGSLIFS